MESISGREDNGTYRLPDDAGYQQSMCLITVVACIFQGLQECPVLSIADELDCPLESVGVFLEIIDQSGSEKTPGMVLKHHI